MRSPENAGEGELIEHGDEKKKKNANNEQGRTSDR
jgi:hypothetical protein